MSELRTLIDFATGENWLMPLDLYERYQRECEDLQLILPKGLTCIEYWLSLLSEEERALVSIY